MIRPNVKDLSTTLNIYYRYSELESRHILELFGSISKSTVTKLRNAVRKEMVNRGVNSHSKYGVDTKIAFDVWAIDIDDIEKRREKLLELNIMT